MLGWHSRPQRDAPPSRACLCRLAEKERLFGHASAPGLLARHNRFTTADMAVVDEDASPDLHGVAAVLERVLEIRGTTRQQRATVGVGDGLDRLGCMVQAGLRQSGGATLALVPRRRCCRLTWPCLPTCAPQVQEVCALVCTRSARLTAAAIAGVLKRLGHPAGTGGAVGTDTPRVVVAFDGSVFSKYDKYR